MSNRTNDQYIATIKAPAGCSDLMPDAELKVQIGGVIGKRRIEAAYLEIDVPRTGELSTLEFDGGQVMVDVDSETGAILGLEILNYVPGPVDLPELMQCIAEEREWFLFTCINTTMLIWIDLAMRLRNSDDCEPNSELAEEVNNVILGWQMRNEAAERGAPSWTLVIA